MTDDKQTTFSTFSTKCKKLNEPQPLTWAVDFMVSEKIFLLSFMCLRVQMTQGQWVTGQFEPQGHGWQDLGSESLCTATYLI